MTDTSLNKVMTVHAEAGRECIVWFLDATTFQTLPEIPSTRIDK